MQKLLTSPAEREPATFDGGDIVLLHDEIKQWISRIEDISSRRIRQHYLVHVPCGNLKQQLQWTKKEPNALADDGAALPARHLQAELAFGGVLVGQTASTEDQGDSKAGGRQAVLRMLAAATITCDGRGRSRIQPAATSPKQRPWTVRDDPGLLFAAYSLRLGVQIPNAAGDARGGSLLRHQPFTRASSSEMKVFDEFPRFTIRTYRPVAAASG
jgi:hypothetical protein